MTETQGTSVYFDLAKPDRAYFSTGVTVAKNQAASDQIPATSPKRQT